MIINDLFQPDDFSAGSTTSTCKELLKIHHFARSYYLFCKNFSFFLACAKIYQALEHHASIFIYPITYINQENYQEKLSTKS